MLIELNIKGFDLQFKIDPKGFSPRFIDPGTLAMLSVVEFNEGDKVLDLGCGYGVVGILATRFIGADRVVMSDIDEKAIKLSIENALLNNVSGVKIIQSDGFKNIKENGFTIILCNPPYHVDFSVPKMFIEKGFNRLAVGGKMYMVTKRKEWYRNKLTSIFGGVKIWDIEGYHVFMSIKKELHYANKKPIKRKEKTK